MHVVRRSWAYRIVVLTLCLVIVPAAADPAHSARTCFPCSGAPTQAPVVRAEPSYTVGESNVIVWGPIPYLGWNPYNTATQDRFDYQVVATDVATGQTSSVTVSAGDYNAPPPQFTARFTRATWPGSPSSVDGRLYRYTVRARTRHCQVVNFNNSCALFGSWQGGPFSSAVYSTQDTTQPTLAITLGNGDGFTNQVRVAADLSAQDPGTHSSGVGSVQFSTDGSFPCSSRLVCTSAFAPVTTVALAQGPDGPRTIFARVFDAAQAPASGGTLGHAPATFGLPPGNASAPASDSIVLDTTGPKLVVTRTPEPQKAGKPVTFDGSQSVDQGGFNADSGLDAATAVWDFGDGTKASGLAASHTYAAAGSYTATLSVKDEVGNESSLAVEVTIMPSDWGGTGTPTQSTGTPSSSPSQVDTTPPTLSNVRERPFRGRLRLTLTLSEPATLIVQMERLRPRPRVIVAARSPAREAGLNTLVLARLQRRARYRVLIAARDAAGNVSPTRVLTAAEPHR